MMRPRGYLFLLISISAWPALANADPPERPGWDVAWYDEFGGNRVNLSKWNVITSTNPTNNSRHAYLPSQVSVADGNLVLTSTNQGYQGLPYRSGQVISVSDQRYGRWEVRAKLPTSRGMWPAIWLLPQSSIHPWPSQGEIDIMENRGDQPNLTSSAFHYGTNPPYNHLFTYAEQHGTQGGDLVNYHDSFHTYAVEWEPRQIRFYVDDVHHATVHDGDVGGFLSSQQTAGMQLIINTAVGGDFLDDPDGSTVWPQEFLIDSVYVYESSAVPAPLTFENGGFDDQAGTLAHWTTFGNRIPNVRASNQHVQSGSGSLKLFGQFTGGENYSGVEQGISVTAGDQLRAISNAFVRAGDSLAGTDNAVTMKIDYYSERYGEFGSSSYLGSDEIVVASAATPTNVWRQHEMRSTVPAGAVEARMVLVYSQPGTGPGAAHFDNLLFGRPGDASLTWDGLGDGNWSEPRWIGPALDLPSDFDRAVIVNDVVTVAGTQEAFATTVLSGGLEIVGVLHGDVEIEPAGTIQGSGSITGDLVLAGRHLLGAQEELSVSGVAHISGADLEIDDAFLQPRGTVSGDFVLLQADSIVGTYAQSPENPHLGDGHFLFDVDYTSNQVSISIYAALPGDATGDGIVDVQDMNIWNAHKFQTGVDWTTGDFNGDGFADISDFNIWNANKFMFVGEFSGAPQSVPEPCGLWLVLGGAAAVISRYRRLSWAHRIP